MYINKLKSWVFNMSYYGNKNKLYEYLDIQDAILFNTDNPDNIHNYIKNTSTDILELATKNILVSNELGLFFEEYNKVSGIVNDVLLNELETRNDFSLKEFNKILSMELEE